MQEFCIEIALHTARFNLKFNNFSGQIYKWVLFHFRCLLYYICLLQKSWVTLL